MPKSNKVPLDRRDFLRSAAVGAAALVAKSAMGDPQRDVEVANPPHVEVSEAGRPASDFMVDVIKTLGFDYVCLNPATSFKGLHESLINYNGNKNPEVITCLHEESAVAMGHGYAKIEGKPLAVCVHGTVGLQHASMAIFNAFCDRVPVYVIAGNTIDATKRGGEVGWDHSAQDAAAMVRDCVKWDDLPVSLNHFSESAVRAYKIAMTPPMMPVLLVLDSELQENAIPNDAKLHIPKLTLPAPPQGDSGAVAEMAKLLVAAENPVVLAGRAARTPAGMDRLVELAEVLQVPVVDLRARLNFPTRHPLNQTERRAELTANADVILGLEVVDLWSPTNNSKAKLLSISSGDLYIKSNYQDFQRYVGVDLDIAADAEETLPSLIESVKSQITPSRKMAFENRGAKLAAAHLETLQRSKQAAAYGWNASPVSTARLSAEVWAQIKNEDWSLLAGVVNFISDWPVRLWTFDKHYQFIGGAGGYGIGYSAPAATGAALANRKYGRLSVNIQQDGDMMFAPGILWTAAHHHIPILNIMHNNRAYHAEVMGVQTMCDKRNRGIENAHIGTRMIDPNIDFAKLAQSMGVYAEGTITDPKDLGPAIRRAIDVVKRGEPALIDVYAQPR